MARSRYHGVEHNNIYVWYPGRTWPISAVFAFDSLEFVPQKLMRLRSAHSSKLHCNLTVVYH